MKSCPELAGLATPLLASSVLTPAGIEAADTPDSNEITKLLKDARAEVVELKYDATEVETLTRLNLTWNTYAARLGMVKEHINHTGKLLAELKEAAIDGSPWQRMAIRCVEPLLKKLAANMEATIEYLNQNQARSHLPEFKAYIRANYELAVDLEALIRDLLIHGATKPTFERLGGTPETT
ncbi:MAG: hypothetical protein WBW33_19215 [Bryobacteraceae bacterium]